MKFVGKKSDLDPHLVLISNVMGKNIFHEIIYFNHSKSDYYFTQFIICNHLCDIRPFIIWVVINVEVWFDAPSKGLDNA